MEVVACYTLAFVEVVAVQLAERFSVEAICAGLGRQGFEDSSDLLEERSELWKTDPVALLEIACLMLADVGPQGDQVVVEWYAEEWLTE